MKISDLETRCEPATNEAVACSMNHVAANCNQRSLSACERRAPIHWFTLQNVSKLI